METPDDFDTDEGYELAAPGLEAPEAEEELAAQEDLEVEAGETLTVDEPPPAPLGRTPAMDLARGRFIPGRAGGPLMIYGLDTLAQWSEKCLRTRREAAPAVHPDFGVEITPEDLIADGSVDVAGAAAAEEDWTRALTFHPRISDVDEWSFTYEAGDDALACSFRIIGSGGEDEGLEPTDLPVTLEIPVAESSG